MALSSFDLELSLPDELMGGLENTAPVPVPAAAPAPTKLPPPAQYGSPGIANGAVDTTQLQMLVNKQQQQLLGSVGGGAAKALQSPPNVVVSKGGVGPMSSMAQHVGQMDGGGLLNTLTSSVNRLPGSPLAGLSIANSMHPGAAGAPPGGGVSLNASVAISSMGNVLSSALTAGPQLGGAALNSVPGGGPVRLGVSGGGAQWAGRPVTQQLVNGPGGALTRTVPAAGAGLRGQVPLQQQQLQQLQQQRGMLPQTSGVMQVRPPGCLENRRQGLIC